MNGPRRKTIGFDRKIRLEWLDATAEHVAGGASLAEVRAMLQSLLEGQVPGSAHRGARDKTITVLLHIWADVPRSLAGLRDDGLSLFRRVPREHRLPLHWGMCLSTYPFFRDVAAMAGRLLRLQGTVALSQLNRRIAESWGERSTALRAAQRVVRSFVLWDVLEEKGERGVFSARPPVDTRKCADIGPWLIEAAISNGERRGHPLRAVIGGSSLFPFVLDVSTRDIGSCPRLEVYRQGLDEDIVTLKTLELGARTGTARERRPERRPTSVESGLPERTNPGRGGM